METAMKAILNKKQNAVVFSIGCGDNIKNDVFLKGQSSVAILVADVLTR